MPGESRESFLARIRASLRDDETSGYEREPLPNVDETLVRLASSEDDVLALFARQASDVGMNVHQLTAVEMPDQLRALIDAHQIRSIMLALDEVQKQIVIEALPADMKLVDPALPGGHDAAFDVDAGISDVAACLAETGTLVVATDADHARSVSLIPPVHIAIVPASRILPDMLDYWQILSDLIPSNQVFITGPSKTADIEGVLVTGVHGPRVVEILIVKDQ